MSSADTVRAVQRRLRFIYSPFESGAPCVDPMAPLGSPDLFADLAVIAGTHDERRLREHYAAALNGLPLVIEACAPKLAPGRYRLEASDAAHLREIFPSPAPGIADDNTFEYADHGLLLPRQRWDYDRGDALAADGIVFDEESETWPIVYVDPKRPYGDMTYYVWDMADVLGIPYDEGHLPEALENHLTRLHHSTPAALRVLVTHGLL